MTSTPDSIEAIIIVVVRWVKLGAFSGIGEAVARRLAAAGAAVVVIIGRR